VQTVGCSQLGSDWWRSGRADRDRRGVWVFGMRSARRKRNVLGEILVRDGLTPRRWAEMGLSMCIGSACLDFFPHVALTGLSRPKMAGLCFSDLGWMDRLQKHSVFSHSGLDEFM
jgi:hypothetical protein